MIAVFDDWDALQAVLEDMAGQVLDPLIAVLHARKDKPPPAVIPGFLKGVTELHFEPSKQRIYCTTGAVADELAARSARGMRSLAEALHSWLSTDQASQLQSHIEKGRLILWLQPQSSEQFGAVCGRLVQASQHMVELCNINFKA